MRALAESLERISRMGVRQPCKRTRARIAAKLPLWPERLRRRWGSGRTGQGRRHCDVRVVREQSCSRRLPDVVRRCRMSFCRPHTASLRRDNDAARALQLPDPVSCPLGLRMTTDRDCVHMPRAVPVPSTHQSSLPAVGRLSQERVAGRALRCTAAPPRPTFRGRNCGQGGYEQRAAVSHAAREQTSCLLLVAAGLQHGLEKRACKRRAISALRAQAMRTSAQLRKNSSCRRGSAPHCWRSPPTGLRPRQ